MSLRESAYQFRLIRGPEYRIISGNFTLEKTSLDEHSVELPRMVDMHAQGWTSGDCCEPASPHSLRLRMAGEDLHLAAVLGHVSPKPIPGRRSEDPWPDEEPWIREDAWYQDGLVLYGSTRKRGRLIARTTFGCGQAAMTKFGLQSNTRSRGRCRCGSASRQVDGMFVLGDWLQLDRQVQRVTDGRGPQGPSLGGGQEVGRWALQIYTNMLEAGLRIAPMAGSGDDARNNPVGYNRLYVAGSIDGRGRETGNLCRGLGGVASGAGKQRCDKWTFDAAYVGWRDPRSRFSSGAG